MRPAKRAGGEPAHGGSRLIPEIDGLRGFAIALVVLYHAGSIPGGYIGVDVFFVVSGFLITGMLIAELRERSRIDLLGFYARRIRRLLPAATVVSLVVAAYVVVLLPVTRLIPTGEEIVASSTFTMNLLLDGREWDYFRDSWVMFSPLFHIWSLSLEEQFYLVWPIAVFLFWRLGRRSAWLVGAALVAIFAASLAYAESTGLFGFFELPARAFELAAGAGLALVAPRIPALGVRVRTIAGLSGLALIAGGAVALDNTVIFPGFFALIPVSGALLTIVGGPVGVGRLLTLPLLTAIGRRSYAIYLVHWPVFVLVFDAFTRENDLVAQAQMIAVSLLVAELLHRLVENPARYSSWLATHRRRTFGAGALMVGVTLAVGLALPSAASRVGSGIAPAASLADLPLAHLTAVVPENLRPTLTDASWQETGTTLPWGCFNPRPVEITEQCVIGDPEGTRTVFVYGDSHSINWGGSLGVYGKANDLRVIGFGRPGCPAIDYDFEISNRYDDPGGCAEIRRVAREWIERERPDAVVMLTSQTFYDIAGSEERTRRFAEATERTVRGYRALGVRVVTLGASPSVRAEVPQCLAEHLDDATVCTMARDDARSAVAAALEREATLRAGGSHIDLFELSCPAERCPVILGDLLLYARGDHLTKEYSVFIAPEFGRRIEALLARP